MDNKNNLNPIRGSPNLLELISKKQEKDKQVFLLSKNRSKSMSDLSSLDESETDNTILLKQQSFLNNNTNNNNTKILNMNYVELIRKLIGKEPKTLNNQILLEIISRVSPLFQNEPQLLELKGPIYICGDIHGQFDDLLKIFRNIGFPPTITLLFMGDYVDRGDCSIEVVALLCLFKIKYPKSIYMLRGNHECHTVNRMYGFYEECQKKSNLIIWKGFNQVFSNLPVAALIDNKIFCVHGGLSPKLIDVRSINNIKKGTRIPESGLLCDLMWADPATNQKEEFLDNDRGVSYTFNQSVVNKFIGLNKLDLVCRAHQVCDAGYEFSFGHKLVTVFSAPNYCGEYGNSAAVMKVDKDLTCSFIILRPVAYIPRAKKANLNIHIN
jgi:serine/threonine-protein phosphatase PP1 catalytic subunit